jgi:hypothetical protein
LIIANAETEITLLFKDQIPYTTAKMFGEAK